MQPFREYWVNVYKYPNTKEYSYSYGSKYEWQSRYLIKNSAHVRCGKAIVVYRIKVKLKAVTFRDQKYYY